MPNTMTALQTVTVGAGGAASVAFTNIPQTYTDLVVKLTSRSNRATQLDGLYLYTAGGANTVNLTPGKKVYLLGDGSATATGYQTNLQISASNGASSTTNTFSNTEIYFPNYTGSTNQKSFTVDSGVENNSVGNAWTWQSGGYTYSTDPITSLTFSSGTIGINLVEYSTFTLYGVYAQENVPSTPSIASSTDFGGGTVQVSIATPSAIPYEVTSSPGGFVGIGQSPVSVSGLSPATAYTFTAKAVSPMGNSSASAASSSITPSKGYVALASFVTDGVTQGVTFSSIPQGYTHLQIRCFMRNGASAPNPDYTLLRFNNDTAANYFNHEFFTNGSTVTSGTFNLLTYGFCGPFSYNSGAYSTANIWSSAIIDVLDYTNTNKLTTVRSIGGFDANGTGVVGAFSGLWNNTAAVTSIFISAANAAEVGNTVYALYGIK